MMAKFSTMPGDLGAVKPPPVKPDELGDGKPDAVAELIRERGLAEPGAPAPAAPTAEAPAPAGPAASAELASGAPAIPPATEEVAPALAPQPESAPTQRAPTQRSRRAQLTTPPIDGRRSTVQRRNLRREPHLVRIDPSVSDMLKDISDAVGIPAAHSLAILLEDRLEQLSEIYEEEGPMGGARYLNALRIANAQARKKKLSV